MKNIIKYVYIIFGSLLVAIGFNLFILPGNFLPFGALGISTLLSYNTTVIPTINLLLINFIFILMASLVIDKRGIYKYILPSILIPLFIFLTSNLYDLLNINLKETMLVILVGSFISGYGYSMIYKVGHKAGVTFLFEEMLGDLLKFHTRIYSWFIDCIILTVYFLQFGLQSTLYSIIIIVVTKYMVKKARFGISDSKMFYIITSKEKEVKNYIIHDLKYELTVLDVKGGFTKKNNKIFLSIISTSDYYKLKEGIKFIDPDAFIAITDTYDVVNRRSF